jgi:iron(III) transport system ATP-binding protein
MSVRLDHVTAGYGGPPVVHDVDLTVATGALTSIVGPSGCGKTTLARTVAGFLRPMSGMISIGDRQMSGPGTFLPPEKRRVGIVPQEGALFPHLDVAGNIGFGIPRGGLPDGTTSDARVEEMLELVGLSGSGNAAPHELSGGQQQRVALARALAPRPDVLLLDEPFSALDAGLRAELRAEVREVLRSVGTTTILVTHDQEEALSISDEVALMIAGQIVQRGTPQDLYANPRSLVAARFLGDLVEIPAIRVSAGIARTPLGDIPVSSTDTTTGVVLIRPENLRRASAHETPLIAGTITSIDYHGHDSLLRVETDAGVPVHVRQAGAPDAALGERISLVMNEKGLMLPNRD